WSAKFVDFDDLDAETLRSYRGTLTEAGTESPYRDRPVAESLDLFRRMRAGEFPDGARVLRAKIDMAAGNINLRDPVLYRILHATHPRTGDQWCVYPTYDFAHGQSDAIEGVSHSICTLEFGDHRQLYDWLIDNLPVPSRPRQYEFARLNMDHTVLSKRRLTQLVGDGHVRGWDDPRMPTLSGLRRRGVPAAAVRDFISRLSVNKNDGTVELALFENSVREVLNTDAERRMAVLDPLKVVIENYPEGEEERHKHYARVKVEFEAHGYCTGYGDWRRDVNGIAVPVTSLNGNRVFGLNVGGPSFHVKKKQLETVFAKRLIRAGSVLSLS
ncbi:MAG: glutamate--tRNA ligase family protein, partial [Thalassobaculaceae bacterium]